VSEILYELVRKTVEDLVVNEIRYLTPEEIEKIRSSTSEYEEKIREKREEQLEIAYRINQRVREYLKREASAFADFSERLDTYSQVKIYDEVKNKLREKDEEIRALERRFNEVDNEIYELNKKVRIGKLAPYLPKDKLEHLQELQKNITSENILAVYDTMWEIAKETTKNIFSSLESSKTEEERKEAVKETKNFLKSFLSLSGVLLLTFFVSLVTFSSITAQIIFPSPLSLFSSIFSLLATFTLFVILFKFFRRRY
jgi:hypothetical protein